VKNTTIAPPAFLKFETGNFGNHFYEASNQTIEWMAGDGQGTNATVPCPSPLSKRFSVVLDLARSEILIFL
jgi:hypothetical protein